MTQEKKSASLMDAFTARELPIGAGVFAVASLAAETPFAAPLALIGILLMVLGVARFERSLAPFFLAGAVFNGIAFYWLPYTIHSFGGFSVMISSLLYALYAVVSALQFVIVGILYCGLCRTKLHSCFLAFPVAWILCEVFFPRMFPWSLVHPFADWTFVSALGGVFGTWGLSFILLWAITAFVTLWQQGQYLRVAIFGVVAILFLFGGSYRNQRLSAEIANDTRQVRVALVQGNLQALQKRDVKMLSANVETYRALSRQALAAGADFIIWPESVLSTWTPEQAGNLLGPLQSLHPLPETTVPILYGALSYRLPPAELMREQISKTHAEQQQYLSEHSKYFNSAFIVDASGAVAGMYHKKVLMPFGEYLPFAETFPSLKTLSPHSGNFTKGDIDNPISVQLGSNQQARVGALICYEDLVSSAALAMTSRGANLLVNQTNDAWYGDSRAPYQHHLLARWRSIETGRYLLRATNTGFTAIVDPRGQTVSSLPLFSEGVLAETVSLRDEETTYMQLGNWPLFGILLVSIVFALASSFLGKRE